MTMQIIQLPCLNEAGQLPATTAALPHPAPGVSAQAWLVVDDASADDWAEFASLCGGHHVVRLLRSKGSATARRAGLVRAQRASADIIVNTDANSRSCADDVPVFVPPILAADLIIVGVMSTAAGVGDDLITINRRPLENPQARQRQRTWVRR